MVDWRHQATGVTWSCNVSSSCNIARIGSSVNFARRLFSRVGCLCQSSVELTTRKKPINNGPLENKLVLKRRYINASMGCNVECARLTLSGCLCICLDNGYICMCTWVGVGACQCGWMCLQAFPFTSVAVRIVMSFIHSFSHSFSHSFIHSFIRSVSQSVILQTYIAPLHRDYYSEALPVHIHVGRQCPVTVYHDYPYILYMHDNLHDLHNRYSP